MEFFWEGIYYLGICRVLLFCFFLVIVKTDVYSFVGGRLWFLFFVFFSCFVLRVCFRCFWFLVSCSRDSLGSFLGLVCVFCRKFFVVWFYLGFG